MRRKGFPCSLQLFKVGRASRLHQHSSKKPTVQVSGLASATSISRSLASLAFFSFIQGVGRGDPAFGPHPPDSQKARERSPNGLPRDRPFNEPLLKGNLCRHLQSPEATLAAKLPRRAVEHLPQGLSLLSILESSMNGVRMLRSRLEGLGKSLLVEGVDGVACGLRIAAQLVSYLVGVLAPGAGEKYLATAQREGIRRAQACLQGLTLGVAQWTHKDWSFHALEDNPQLPSCLEMH